MLSRDKLAKLEWFEKVARNAVATEWNRANNGTVSRGGTPEQLQAGMAQANMRGRYAHDVSIGGAEAGVDRMIGDANAPQYSPQVQSPMQERLQAYKANKAQLGLQGRNPAPEIMANQQGRGALLRGQQAPQQAPAPNPSGDFAQKLYKPDSGVSRGEGTTELLHQKQVMTDTARSMSPEARNMVPAMYGSEAHQTPGGLRHTSRHEYIPNIVEHPDPMGAAAQAHKQVLGPMARKGLIMQDVAVPLPDPRLPAYDVNPGN